MHGYRGAQYKRFDAFWQAQEYLDEGAIDMTTPQQPSPHTIETQTPQVAPTGHTARVANESKWHTVFCDGASLNNGIAGRMRGGVGVYSRDLNLQEWSHCGEATNQQCELIAIEFALHCIDDKLANVEIHTDSMYAVRGLTEWIHDWRRRDWQVDVKNLALFQRVE